MQKIASISPPPTYYQLIHKNIAVVKISCLVRDINFVGLKWVALVSFTLLKFAQSMTLFANIVI